MSSKEWLYYKIGELGKIVTGKTPPTIDKENFDGKYPFITPVDMNGQKEIHKTNRTLSETGKQLMKNYLLPTDTICVSCIGSDLGKVVKTTKDSFTNQQINSIICNDNFDADFVYYALTLLSPELRNIGHQSTAVPIINKSDFSLFEILAPDNKEKQAQVAEILSSIDNKIEVNRQTNQTLEEIASTIFKEWFVNFNYPNADGGRKHSELGEIPSDWKVGTLADIYKTTSGGTPSRAKLVYYENGIYQWVKSKELNNTFIIDTEEKITEAALKNSSAKILPKHSVLIAMYGATVGEIGITTEAVTCNQAICAFLPNENYPYTFIYHFLLQCKQDIINQAVGSAQQNISQQLLLQYKLVIPIAETVKEFHRIISPLFEKIQDNIEENESLKNFRDSLLPKLMSGQIPIKISNS